MYTYLLVLFLVICSIAVATINTTATGVAVSTGGAVGSSTTATGVAVSTGGVVGSSRPVPVELIIGLLSALVVVLIVVAIGAVCLAAMITRKKKTTVRNLQEDVLSRYQGFIKGQKL